MLRRSNALIILLGESKGERLLSEARYPNPIAPAVLENGTIGIGGTGAGANAGARGRCSPTDVVEAVGVEAVSVPGGCDA